jgi:trehalose 6-phosphate synthase
LHDLCSGDGDVVLINDHQFLLVPGFLRRLGARRCAAVVYFHPLPWCQSDYLALLPHEARDQILTSLLTCDVVGFHARRWTEAFLSCCARYLPSAQVSDAEVVLDGHTTRMVVAPGPVNGPTLARLAEDPHTAGWRERLAGRAAGRRILVRAERFDLWKNVARGLSAYECLLERRPRLARDVWFCALLSATRRATPRHLRERRDVGVIVAGINDRYGGAGLQPVSVLWGQSGDNSQHRVVAALQLSSTTLVNPTYDRLNLVAKESLLFAPAAPVACRSTRGRTRPWPRTRWGSIPSRSMPRRRRSARHSTGRYGLGVGRAQWAANLPRPGSTVSSAAPHPPSPDTRGSATGQSIAVVPFPRDTRSSWRAVGTGRST